MTDHATLPEIRDLDTAVYIRAVAVEGLEPDIDVPEGLETVYALHDGSGRRLALFGERAAAFAVARSNDLEPLSAH